MIRVTTGLLLMILKILIILKMKIIRLNLLQKIPLKMALEEHPEVLEERPEVLEEHPEVLEEHPEVRGVLHRLDVHNNQVGRHQDYAKEWSILIGGQVVRRMLPEDERILENIV